MSTRSARSLLFATAALALAYWAWSGLSPNVLGIWQDDAIYVATAQSLAEGSGYRHIELASQPLQTKYPILYPALLAPAFWLGGSFPDNRLLLLLPTAVAAAALLGLCVLYFQRALGEGARLAWTLGSLAAISPVFLDSVRYTMSDLPYAALALGALVCLDWFAIRAGDSGVSGAPRRWLALGGAFVGLAILTRSVGLALAVAAIGAPLLRRRWADAGVVAGSALALAAPWWIWRTWAAAANGDLQTALMDVPELGYGIWLPGSAAELLRVVQQNFVRGSLSLSFQLGLPADFVLAGILEGGGRTLVLHLMCYALVALAAVGFVRSARTRLRTVHLYAVAYLGLVIAWPFPPDRFLVPWLPFALYFLVLGARAAGDRFSVPPPQRRHVARAAVALGALLFLSADLRILGSTAQRYALASPASLDLEEVDKLASWLSQNTAPSDVIASAWPAGLFLRTGRRGHFLWPDSDPYALYYGADRSFAAFYALASPSEDRTLIEDMRRNLVPAYQSAGIDYYVDFGPAHTETQAMARIMREHPRVFELRYETPRKTGRIYRVH